MAITTIKITSLPAAVALDGSDLIHVIGDVGGDPFNKKVTMFQLLDWLTESGGVGIGDGGLADSGSPEGVVTASPGRTYFDSANDVFYVKKTGNGSIGWVQLI